MGYVLQSNAHYIENTGDTDLVFLEMFRTAHYEDISLAEWMAHTPHLLVDQHLRVGEKMLEEISNRNRSSLRFVSLVSGNRVIARGWESGRTAPANNRR